MPEPLINQDLMRRLEQLALVSRKISTGRIKGERRSRRRGSSNEFADYRNYVPGDDLRFLDWKIYGRLDRLFLKLFLEEEDLRVNILLDGSPSMQFGEPDKFLYARQIAAAIGYVALTKMDSVVLNVFGDGLGRHYGPHRGKQHGTGYLGFLAGLEPAGGPTSLLKAFRAFSLGSKGKGMAIVLSDFYDFAGYEDALRQLFARDFEVLVVHILSPQELKPDHQGDIRLLDREFGLTTDVSMGPSVLAMYDRTLTAFCNGIKNFVIGRGGSYLLASTALPFERLVLDVLRRRGVLR